MKSTEGEITDYEPMHWQEEYHATCMLCYKDDPLSVMDRIVDKSRKIGFTAIECVDVLSCAMYFPASQYPISSITERTGITPIEWLTHLCDTATPAIERDIQYKTQIVLENGSRIFECPGGNPDSIRGYNTPKCFNDEFGRCPYNLAHDMFQASRGTMSGFWVQHDIGSTMPEQADHEFNKICDQANELGFRRFTLSMFPMQFFDKDKSMIEQVDEEFLEAFRDLNIKRMRELCDRAWDAGMWKITEPLPDHEHEKYWGCWPEDRGLIPLCWWWNLEKRNAHFEHDLPGALREYMCSKTEGTGLFFPDDLLSKIAIIPVQSKLGYRWIYEDKGDGRHIYYMGWDFASKKHKACVSIFRQGRQSLDQIYVELMDKMATPQQKLKLRTLIKAFPTTRGIGIDATGVGTGFAEEVVGMHDEGIIRANIVPFYMNMRTRLTWIDGEELEMKNNWACAWNFKMMAEKTPTEVRILNSLDIKRDFQLISEETLKASVDSTTGSHADIASASMIACMVPRRLPSPGITFMREERPQQGYIDPREKGLLMLQGRLPLKE
jgi:hypothetical protein